MAKAVAKGPKRRKVQDEVAPADGLGSRLAAYGERFMQMFDDHGSDDDTQPAPASTDGEDGLSSDSMPASDDVQASSGSSDSSASSSGEEKEDTQEKPGRGSHIVEHIFDGRRSSAGVRSSLGGGPGSALRGAGTPGGAGGLPATPAAAAQQAQQAAELARLKMERKRFMSGKAAVVSGGQQQPAPSGRRRGSSGGAAATPLLGTEAGGDGDGVSREEFLQMQREVQLLGATALDKKARRKFDAEQLARIGAKAASRPRIPASIGVGMARKQAQRDERALQEGIAAGMIQQKGLGKKKRREKAKQMDRGLNEDGGAFKPGVLRVKPLAAGGGGGGKRRR